MLPQEIIFDISLRLPPKPVGQFRCVSTLWQRLLSQPHFIKAYATRSKQHPREESLILVSSDYYISSMSNAHHVFDGITTNATKLNIEVHPDSWIEGIPSCDGLVLIRTNGDERFIFNPITRAIRELPVSPYALDPHASFTMYGLGYDQVNDDYKVVTLSYYDTDNEHEPDCTEMFVNVFSVRNGTWKRAQSSPYDHAVGHVTSGVCVNGCIHWLASSRRDYSSAIVGFDLAEEKFHEVPSPSAVDGQKFVFNRLVVLGGCLCMFPTRRSSEIDVWVMKEYGVQESWTNLTLVDPEEAEFRPLCMMGKQEVVMVKDEETTDEKLVTYNLDNGRYRVVEVHGINADEFHVGGTFMESLSSPYYNCET